METLPCPICQTSVVVPVHFTCFSCACGEDYCVCLQCARNYLQLNRDRDEWAPQRKCLLCPATTYLSPMDESKCLRKNRIYMRMDANVYPCFHGDLGCEFRGTQRELDRHVDHECVYRTLRCPCGACHTAHDAQKHYIKCSHHKKCPMCETYVHLDASAKHLQDEHGLVACVHVGCPEIVATDALEEHLGFSCRHRLVSCAVCHQKKTVVTLSQHMSQHLSESRLEVDRAVEQLIAAQKKMTSVVDAFHNTRS